MESFPASGHGEREVEEFIRSNADLSNFLKVFLIRLSSSEGSDITCEGAGGHFVGGGLIGDEKLLIFGGFIFAV